MLFKGKNVSLRRPRLAVCFAFYEIIAISSCSSKATQEEPKVFIRQLGFLNDETLIGISKTAKGNSLWYYREHDPQPQIVFPNTSDDLRFVPGSVSDACYVMARKNVRGLKNFTYYRPQLSETGKVTFQEINPANLSADTETYSSILGVLNRQFMLVLDLSNETKGEYAVLDCRTLKKLGSVPVGAKESSNRMLMPRLVSTACGPDANYCVVIESDVRASRDGGLIALLLQIQPAVEIERIVLSNRPFQIIAGPTRDSVVALAYTQLGTLYGTELSIKLRDGQPTISEQKFNQAGAISFAQVYPQWHESVAIVPKNAGGLFASSGATLAISKSGEGKTKPWKIPVDPKSDYWGYAVSAALDHAVIWDGGMGFKVYDLNALNAEMVPASSVAVSPNLN